MKCVLNVWICLLIGFTVSTLSARADVLLIIDISNMADVKITATDNYSAVNDSDSILAIGITLQDFFQEEGIFNTFELSPGLAPIGIDADFSTAENSSTNTNLYLKNTTGAPETFSDINYTTDQVAFIGASSLDMSGVEIAFGSTGDITVGNGGSGSGKILGQWSVIPEPGHFAVTLALAGLASLVVLRRRRRS